MDGLTAPNFAEKHPRLNRDLGPRTLINDTPRPRNTTGETQEGNSQDGAGNTTTSDKSDYTATAFEHVDVECDLLCSSPQPQSHSAYRTLGHDRIRLLKILPATSTAEIRCQLDEFTLHETLAYTALSYTWGSQHGVHRIYINDHPLLVPKNLWRFLDHARDLAGDLTGWIWCDMLSINQIDLAERGHQVKLMSRIFKTAQIVVVWLGPAYRGSDTAMSALSRLRSGRDFVKQASQLWAGDAGHAMSGICSRPYWRRLWVFQEVRLAQQIRLMCGSKTASWYQFESLLQYAHARSGIPQLDDNTEAVMNSPAMRIMNLNLKSVDTALWSLIQETTHLRCFDLKDKIYALLGVATKGHGTIEPDYTIGMPTLPNKLLREIRSESPPETLEEAVEGCAKIEDVLGVERGTMFIIQGQRGRYKTPSDVEMRSCRLGPKSGNTTLWWAAFYGHSRVQAILQESWTLSHFGGYSSEQNDAQREGTLTSTSVVSLFQFLCKDTDSRNSFLSLEDTHAGLEAEDIDSEDNFSGLQEVYAALKKMDSRSEGSDSRGSFPVHAGVEDSHHRNEFPDLEGVYAGIQNVDDQSSFTAAEGINAEFETGRADEWNHSVSLGADARYEIERTETDDAEVRDGDACMSWVAFYLTEAIDLNDSHITRLMLDVGLSCGLLYTQYRPIATLIEATAGALRRAIGSKDTVLLETMFARAGPFIPDTDRFVTEMIDHGRLMAQSGLLLELGLANMISSNQRAGLLDTAFSKALFNKNDEAVDALLPAGGCDPNFVYGRPSLSYCISSLQASSFRTLLDTGKCDLHAADPSNGMTPLMQAASKGLHVFVRILVATGACQLNDANELDGMTPLLYAARGGYTDTILESLADERCNIEKADRHGNTALTMALSKDHESAAELLSAASHRSEKMPRALISASASGFHKVVEALLESHDDCNVNLRDSSGETSLLVAARKGRWKVVEILLQYPDCNVNLRDLSENTPLMLAAKSGHVEVVLQLLACERCGVNASDKKGMTALMLVAASIPESLSMSKHLASYRSHNLNVRLPENLTILNAIADSESCDINAEDVSCWTAVMHAGYNWNPFSVDALLATRKCNIDKPLRNGDGTLLHIAVSYERPFFMQRLLRQKDLDLCVRDGKGQTPLIVAATVLGHDNVKMLLGYGYRTNCGADMRSNDGNTALSHAVEAGDFNMVSLLASSWYVRDVKDKNGKPLYMQGTVLGF
jgi:ankyrin repeat protein